MLLASAGSGLYKFGGEEIMNKEYEILKVTEDEAMMRFHIMAEDDRGNPKVRVVRIPISFKDNDAWKPELEKLLKSIVSEKKEIKSLAGKKIKVTIE